ncbi:hypothetical protein L596_017655 [Steinernema carpocapsae]|uniref:Uncharacterized protein n=1 Tax=Steinernema carpocapsae TaxID=34508 RepID=A0A4U5N2K2_STECR|nr:hypothetical protein L596_017655 [Steinernema carpocapsae]
MCRSDSDCDAEKLMICKEIPVPQRKVFHAFLVNKVFVILRQSRLSLQRADPSIAAVYIVRSSDAVVRKLSVVTPARVRHLSRSSRALDIGKSVGLIGERQSFGGHRLGSLPGKKSPIRSGSVCHQVPRGNISLPLISASADNGEPRQA